MLLQYPVQFHLFRDHGRLNPEVPLEEAGDCGANALFLLGLIEEEDANVLSRQQNICWSTKSGKESTPRYVFKNYLFTDHSKEYEVIQCNKQELMAEVQKLTPGYGTFLFMNDDTKLGHSTCIYKNEETHKIELADLQTEEIISNDYEPDRLDTYLSDYTFFYIPSMLTSPVRHEKDSIETILSNSHGSPAKKIPSPLRHGEDSENVDSYRSPVKHRTQASESPFSFKSPEKTLRSTLTPLRNPKRPRIGGKRTKRIRKRRTRRKN